jgi:hypothetical protein
MRVRANGPSLSLPWWSWPTLRRRPRQDRRKEEIVQGGHRGCAINQKQNLLFEHTRMRLIQCSWEGDWATFWPVWKSLEDSTDVARRAPSSPTPIFSQKIEKIGSGDGTCAKMWLDSLELLSASTTVKYCMQIGTNRFLHIHAHWHTCDTYSPKNNYNMPTTYLQYMFIPTWQYSRIGRGGPLIICMYLQVSSNFNFLVTIFSVSCQYLVGIKPGICRYCKYVSVSMLVTFFHVWDTYPYNGLHAMLTRYWQDPCTK